MEGGFHLFVHFCPIMVNPIPQGPPKIHHGLYHLIETTHFATLIPRLSDVADPTITAIFAMNMNSNCR